MKRENEWREEEMTGQEERGGETIRMEMRTGNEWKIERKRRGQVDDKKMRKGVKTRVQNKRSGKEKRGLGEGRK